MKWRPPAFIATPSITVRHSRDFERGVNYECSTAYNFKISTYPGQLDTGMRCRIIDTGSGSNQNKITVGSS
jgi:hypothetical protein